MPDSAIAPNDDFYLSKPHTKGRTKTILMQNPLYLYVFHIALVLSQQTFKRNRHAHSLKCQILLTNFVTPHPRPVLSRTWPDDIV